LCAAVVIKRLHTLKVCRLLLQIQCRLNKK